MGKVEKLIVLSVLFVVAVILVVSLTMDDPLKKERVALASGSEPKLASLEKPAPAADRAAATGPRADAEPPAAAAPAAAKSSTPDAGAARPTALLSTTVQPAAQAPAPIPEAIIPPGSILKTLDGLQDSYLPDMKFYTWRAGDSFRTVAYTYYGDYAKLTVLRRANEGRQEVQPGEKILVPVFDGEPAAVAAAAPSTTARTPAVASAEPATIAAPEARSAVARASGAPRTHVVKDGESLWKIAKQELGAGSRWNEIYEANRDVLATPEALHTGQRLRIP